MPFCSNTWKIVPSLKLCKGVEAPVYSCSVKRLYRKILREFTGKHVYRSPFLINLQAFNPSLQHFKKSMLLELLLKVERRGLPWNGLNWLICYMKREALPWLFWCITVVLQSISTYFIPAGKKSRNSLVSYSWVYKEKKTSIAMRFSKILGNGFVLETAGWKSSWIVWNLGISWIATFKNYSVG